MRISSAASVLPPSLSSSPLTPPASSSCVHPRPRLSSPITLMRISHPRVCSSSHESKKSAHPHPQTQPTNALILIHIPSTHSTPPLDRHVASSSSRASDALPPLSACDSSSSAQARQHLTPPSIFISIPLLCSLLISVFPLLTIVRIHCCAPPLPCLAPSQHQPT